MTPEQMKRGAELFAAGHSEREVAEVLGCSASTAHRLRERLQVPQDAADDSALPPEPAELQGDDVAELSVLRDLRDAQAENVRTFEERTEISRSAATQLELERREALRAGRDAAQFRARIANAQADARDAAEQAAFAREDLAATDARIAEIEQAQNRARIAAEADAARSEWARARERTGPRQEAALAALEAAVAEFAAAVADEQQAEARCMALETEAARAGVVLPPFQAGPSTAMSVPGGLTYGGPGLALYRALDLARQGRPPAEIAAELGRAYGFRPPAPPTPEEIEQGRKLAAERQRQLEEMRARDKAGIGAAQVPGLSPWDADAKTRDLGGDRVPAWARDWRHEAYPGPW